MKKLQDKVLNAVKKVAFNTAVKNANTACPVWSYQTKLPEAVKKLRKF